MPLISVQCRTERHGGGRGGHLYLPGPASADGLLLDRPVRLAVVDRPAAARGRFLWKAGAEDWLTQRHSLRHTLHHSRNDGEEEYLSSLERDLAAVRELLSPDGSVWAFADQRASARVRMLLDDAFGRSCFLNEIIWAKEAGLKPAGRFTRSHDTIFLYGKGPKPYFNAGAAGRARGRLRSHMKRAEEGGRAYYARQAGGKVYRYFEDDVVSIGDVWTDIPEISARDEERTGWEGQRPEALLARIVAASSEPGDIVCDVCSGAAAAAVAAHRLGRRALLFGRLPQERLLARRRLLLCGAADIELVCDTEACPAPPDADACVDGDTIRLNRYGPASPAGGTLLDDGLGSLEYWAAGRRREGVFAANAWAMRTRQTPALPRELPLGPGEGQPCLHLVDASGEQWFFSIV